MAKYVIAGKSNCPFYARIELLADELQQRLPEFSVHKITLKPDDWGPWIDLTCKERGWSYDGESPLVWRELINRGGKGVLVGSSNEFLEIAKGYYALTMDESTTELKQIAVENEAAKVTYGLQEVKRTSCLNPYKITVTDVHKPLAYNFLPHIASRKLCPQIKDIYLTLYSFCMDEEEENLKGISMELMDCANQELRKVTLEKDVDNAFVDADLIIIINSSEINTKSISSLKSYGSALNKAKNTARVIVAGVQPMIACYIISQEVKTVPKTNIFALSRLQENKVKASLAKKLSINTPNISNVIIWGSSKGYVLHHANAVATQYNGAVWAPHLSKFTHSVNEMVYDKAWLTNELRNILDGDTEVSIAGGSNNEPGITISNTDALDKNSDTLNPDSDTLDSGANTLNPTSDTSNQGNGNDNAEKEGSTKKNYMSHSAALISQVEDILSSKQENLFSLGVISNGCFGIPEGLVFSVPCTCKNGKVMVNENVLVDDNTKTLISRAAEKLKEYCDELMQS